MNVPCVMLIGLPGTGKSECAKLTAELLNWSFGDTDKWIESAYGATIAELFVREGEPFFRDLERIILERLASPTLDPNFSNRQLQSLSPDEPDKQRQVINRLLVVIEQAKQEAEAKGGVVLATGGGMPVPSHNQTVVQSLGLCFYLACDLDVLSQRLAGDSTRPLLQSTANDDNNGRADLSGSQKDATRKRLQGLLDARRSAYGIAGEEIDTTDMTTSQVADKLKDSIVAKINM
jgi:shikimate kinase